MITYKRVPTFLFIATVIVFLRGLYTYWQFASSPLQPAYNYAASPREIKLEKFAAFPPPEIDGVEDQSPKISENNLTCKGSKGWITYPKVPSFIIAGAQKSGTTALYGILKKHPKIISKRGRNEAHYFTRHFFNTSIQVYKYRPSIRGNMKSLESQEFWCDRGLAYIKNIFGRRMHRFIDTTSFEKTPAYLHYPHVPELISIICPWKPKIVVILRNPVDRAYSHFDMDPIRYKNHTFEEAISKNLRKLKKAGVILKEGAANPKWLKHELTYGVARLDNNMLFRGFYATQLELWFEHFPLGEKLMVIRYEKFMENKAAVMNQILEFVGVSQYNYTHDILHKNYFGNKTKTNIVHGVSNSTRASLRKFFKPHNDKLADLLGEEWRDVW
mmetsp:Transcript_33971/g.40682  ORF Transcript_33971/g.40682 Transcript_33971/m.40682 type:complete len:386 (-) Transcript_33971:177-1334(-)